MKNKNVLVTGIIVLVLVVGGFMLTSRGDADKKKSVNDITTLPDNEVIPTVDASVLVTLTADKLLHEATLTVDSYPEGTTSIEYALSYDASVDGENVPKGVIGDFELDPKSTKVTKQVTLGTCSSGTCKYDKIMSKVTVDLKFKGTYGAKIYKGDFDL